MKTYSLTDFMKTNDYKSFMSVNPGAGNLKIRAYAASSAIPISGLKVLVEKTIDDKIVIFFEGKTDESGMIETIKLPAPKENENNLLSPKFTTYQVIANYAPDNVNTVYSVNLYDGICVVQNINIIPDLNLKEGV